MAYLVDSALSFSTSGGASFALNMPQHTTNDVLVAIVGEDGVGTLAMTGWLQIGTTLSSAGHSSAIFYKVATSASETGTVTMGAADAISTIVMSLRDVDVSTIATTDTSGTGATATITFADQGSTPFLAGTIVTVAGVTPAGYNGTYVSTGGSSTTVTYANATTGSQTVAGTVTAQVDNSTQTSVAAASQFSSISLTTNKNDTFVLYAVSVDGVAPMIHSDPGPAMFISSSDSTGGTATTSASSAAAWYIQRTAGATPTPSWTVDKSNVNNKHTISFRNKTGGSIPAYIDDVTSPGTVLTPLHHIGAAGLNGINYTTSLPYANIGPGGSGLTTTYDAATLTADYGINYFSSAVTTTPAAQAAGTSGGFVIAKASGTWDFSTGFVVGSVIAANPKMANFFHGTVAQGGSWLSFGDASNFYRSYQVLASNSKPNTEGRAVFSIQVGQTDTQYGYSSSALSASAVTTIMFLSNNPLATVTFYLSELHLAKTHVIAGGDATIPVDAVGVASVGKSFRLQVIQQIGASGLLSYVPIQVGGGDAVNLQIDAGALQFPRRWNTTKKELNFHATDGAIGISYAGKSGDVIAHTNSVVTSPSSYYWEINSAATSAATWDFSGLVVVGAVVTLRNVMTFTAMTFSSCSSITASSCALSNCTISNVPASNDSITVNSTTTFTGCTIDVSTVTAGNYWVSTATPNQFSTCAFTGGGGHAIRITSTAGSPYTLAGNTFTGFGSTGSTGAAIYNDSGGAIVINISGGVASPTYRNGTSASTTINNNISVTVTILNQSGTAIPGVEVAIFQDNAARTVVLASTATNGSGQVAATAAASLGAIIIRARQSTNIATFNTGTGVASGTEIITTVPDHKFQTGDEVVYSRNGGTQDIGPEPGTYFINRISDSTIYLYDTVVNAIAGGATGKQDLTSGGSETHTLNPVRYVAGSATGTIGATNFSTQITLITDAIATG